MSDKCAPGCTPAWPKRLQLPVNSERARAVSRPNALCRVHLAGLPASFRLSVRRPKTLPAGHFRQLPNWLTDWLMQALVYDKNLVNATKRSAAHSGVSDKQKQGHCFAHLFCSLQFIQKCQRIICSHFLLRIISPTIRFAHPQHCCHLWLPAWLVPTLVRLQELILKFPHKKVFPPKMFHWLRCRSIYLL